MTHTSGSSFQLGHRRPAPVAPRCGSKREELLTIIKQNNGLTRGEILERMGLKGNKQGEMSVSNALTALTKANQVRRNDAKKFKAYVRGAAWRREELATRGGLSYALTCLRSNRGVATLLL